MFEVLDCGPTANLERLLVVTGTNSQLLACHTCLLTYMCREQAPSATPQLPQSVVHNFTPFNISCIDVPDVPFPIIIIVGYTFNKDIFFCRI